MSSFNNRRTDTRLSFITETTTTTRPNTAQTNQEWIISILEGRGIGREIGVILIEKEIGKVIITQYPDTPTYVKSLHLFTTRPPSLILVPTSSLATQTNQSQSFQPNFNIRNPGNQSREDQDSERRDSVVEGEEGNERGIGAKGEISLLVRSLKDSWPGVPIVGVARKYWNERQGYEFLTQLILQDPQRTAALTAVKSKYFALSAACALFKYLESTHNLIFPPRSLSIEYQALEGTCWIDRDSVEELELVGNITNKNSKQHLLGLLNHCYTPMATRLLRTNILSPLTETKTIDDRLDVVEELVASEERFNAIRKSLEPLKNLDLDKLIYQIISSRPRLPSSTTDPSKDSELKISRILQLRTFLNALPSLRSALQGTSNSLLSTIKIILNDDRTSIMLREINDTFNKEAMITLQKSSLITRNTRIYAIRAEKKLLLDVARETFKEGMNDAYILCESMKDRLGWEIGLVFGNNGFVFSVLKEDVIASGKDLVGGSGSREFINVNKKGKKWEFSTLELKKRNARIMESVQEIFLMSDEILDELLAKVRDGIACLYRSTEAIAMLDMLASFADVATKNNYIRPEWTETLAIKAGRHPLHEHFRLSDGAFVPNDTYANASASFQIVGGSNMSGKSTLLRQIALLYIMAQIGCYVPAQYASFTVVDALFTRLGNDDSIEASLSTFSKEMQTMAMILSAMKLCNRCLIIVDELGRGTSPAEGVGIAHAIAEKIIEAKALCFFATHFKELSTTLGRYPNVVSLHLETEIDTSQSEFSMTFHHRVVDGNSPLTHYGLELAKLAKLPTDVLERARIVSNSLESLAEEGRLKAQSTKLSIRRKELLKLKTYLQELSTSRGISTENLLETLRRLQKDGIKMLLSTLEVAAEVEVVEAEVEAEVDPLSGSLKEASVRDRNDGNMMKSDDSTPSTSPTPVGTTRTFEEYQKKSTVGDSLVGDDRVFEDEEETEMKEVEVKREESLMLEMETSEMSMFEIEVYSKEEDETLEF